MLRHLFNTQLARRMNIMHHNVMCAICFIAAHINTHKFPTLLIFRQNSKSAAIEKFNTFQCVRFLLQRASENKVYEKEKLFSYEGISPPFVSRKKHPYVCHLLTLAHKTPSYSMSQILAQNILQTINYTTSHFYY